MATVTELDAVTIADAVQVLTYGEDSRRVRDRRARDRKERPRSGGELVRTHRDSRVRVNLARGIFFSYGEHFPLAAFVPRDGRHGPTWLVNSERWSQGGWNSRTNDHQEATRAAIAATGVRSILLPFPTLDAAGIDYASIRPVHVRADAQWTETRFADRLVDVPRHERRVSYSVERESRALADVPPNERRTWRVPTSDEVREARERGEYLHASTAAYCDRLPDADGVYRWEEWRTRDRERDADGRYSWTVNVHRMGDSLFSAVRPEERERRPRPGESVRVNAGDWTTRELCAANPYAPGDGSGAAHIADATGRACIFCRAEARPIVERVRRRSLFLSSFDLNESPPLYFLAELPRGTGARTVEEALDALAPPAVHAARARGREVFRQGDIFFIETDATSADLAERGATFARLTQWTRDAAPRRGEVGHIPTETAADRRRRDRREARERAKEWRRGFRNALAQVSTSGPADAIAHEARRAELRAEWETLLTRQRAERAPVLAAGIEPSDVRSTACETCGAAIGAPCSALVESERVPRFLVDRTEADRERYGAHRNRGTLAAAHEAERRALRDRSRGRKGSANGYSPGRPTSEHGARGKYAARRDRAAADVAEARRNLRTLALGGIPSRSFYARPSYGGRPTLRTWRASLAEEARRARKAYADAERRYAQCWHARGADRDAYRAPWNRGNTSTAALITWHNAVNAARLRVRPETVEGSEANRRRREAVRRACAIYGTAHGATETARTRDGAFYARGTVRHVPTLEPNRGGRPDHRPTRLGDGARWYLAVRNTVPRQRRGARAIGAAR